MSSNSPDSAHFEIIHSYFDKQSNMEDSKSLFIISNNNDTKINENELILQYENVRKYSDNNGILLSKINQIKFQISNIQNQDIVFIKRQYAILLSLYIKNLSPYDLFIIDLEDLNKILEVYNDLIKLDINEKGLTSIVYDRDHDFFQKIELENSDLIIHNNKIVLEVLITRIYATIFQNFPRIKCKSLMNKDAIAYKILKSLIDFARSTLQRIYYDIRSKIICYLQIINKICFDILIIHEQIFLSEDLKKYYMESFCNKEVEYYLDLVPFLRLLILNFYIKIYKNANPNDNFNDNNNANANVNDNANSMGNDAKEQAKSKSIYLKIGPKYANYLKFLRLLNKDFFLLEDNKFLELQFEFDSNYKTYGDLLQLAKIVLGNFFAFIMNSLHIDHAINQEIVAEAVILIFEDLTSDEFNPVIKGEILFWQKNEELHQVLESMINLKLSQSNFMRLIRIIFKACHKKRECLNEHEILRSLWDSLQAISFLKAGYNMQYLITLIDLLRESFHSNIPINETSSFLLPPELLIRIHKYIKYLISLGENFIEQENFLEKFINLIIAWPIAYFAVHKTEIKRLLHTLYDSKKEDLVVLYIKNNKIMEDLFLKLFIPEKDELFFVVMGQLYPLIIKDKKYADLVLKYILIYFKTKNELENHNFDNNIDFSSEYNQKSMIFLLRLLIKLICQETILDFKDFFDEGLSAEKTKIIEIISITQIEIIQYDILNDIHYYQTILHTLDHLKLYNRQLGIHLMNLIFYILYSQKSIRLCFRDNRIHLKLYDIMNKINQHISYSDNEILELLNNILNIATNNDYYHIVQKKIPKINIDQINVNIFNQYKIVKKCLKYIHVYIDFMLEFGIKMIIEWSQILYNCKIFYLTILDKILRKSLSNVVLCGKGHMVHSLLKLLKKETNSKIKKILSNIIISIKKVSASPDEINTFMKIMRYQHHENISNFTETLKHGFHILKTVFEKFICILNIDEDNQGFINFYGENSGILISSIRLSFLKLSFIINFRLENSISPNISLIYQKLDEILDVKDPSSESSLPMVNNFNPTINNDNKNIKYLKIDEDKTNIIKFYLIKNNQQKELIDNYEPRLFSLDTKQFVIDLYIQINRNTNRRELVLKAKLKKGDKSIIEIFDINIITHKWYNAILTYSSKSLFKVYIDGILISKSKNSPSIVLPNAINENCVLSIGSSLSEINTKNNVKGINPLHNFENNFIGQIKNFQILKNELNGEEVINYIKSSYGMQYHSEKLTRSNIFTKYIKSFTPENPLVISIVPTIASLCTINAPNKTKFNNNPIPQIRPSSPKSNSPLNKTRKLSMGNSTDWDINPIIYYDCISYMEKSCFDNVFFSVANIDVLYYHIDKLTIFNKMDKDDIQEILCGIIMSIIQILKCQSKADAHDFLKRNYGYEILGYLIKEFIHRHFASKKIFEKLHELVNQARDLESLKRAVLSLLLDFEMWKRTDIETQVYVLEFILDFLLSIPDLFKTFKTESKENYFFLSFLHYYETLDPQYDQKLRNILKNIIKKIILKNIDDKILKDEFECIVGFLCNTNLKHNKDNIEEYLNLIINLIEINDKDNELDLQIKKKILSILISDFKIIRVLFGLMIEINSLNNNANVGTIYIHKQSTKNPIDNGYINHMNLIKCILINLFRLLFFQIVVKDINNNTFIVYDYYKDSREIFNMQHLFINILKKVNIDNNSNIYSNIISFFNDIKKSNDTILLLYNNNTHLKCVYDLFMGLLLYKYLNNDIHYKLKTGLLFDINDIMQRNIHNWQLFYNAKNSTSFIISIIDECFNTSNTTNNNNQECEYLKLELIENYIKYLFIYKENSEILSYFLCYNNYTYFFVILKIIHKILKEIHNISDRNILSINLCLVYNLLYDYLVQNEIITQDHQTDLLRFFNIVYAIIIENKINSVYYPLKIMNINNKLDQALLKSKFRKGEIPQNGGLITLLLNIMIICLKKMQNSESKIEILGMIQEIFQNCKLIFCDNGSNQQKKCKYSNKFSESVLETNDLSNSKRHNMLNHSYIFEFTFYYLIKILYKYHKINLNSQKELTNSKLMQILVTTILIVFQHGSDVFETVCRNFPPELLGESTNKNIGSFNKDNNLSTKSTQNNFFEQTNNLDLEFENFIQFYNNNYHVPPETNKIKSRHHEGNHPAFETIQALKSMLPNLIPKANLIFSGKIGSDKKSKEIIINDKDPIQDEKVVLDKVLQLIINLKTRFCLALYINSIRSIKLIQKLNHFWILFRFQDIQNKISLEENKFHNVDLNAFSNQTGELVDFAKEKNIYQEDWSKKIIEYENEILSKTCFIRDKWNQMEKNLESERGICRNQNIDISSLKWKIDKAFDMHNRRLFLKPDRKALDRVYLNQAQFLKHYKSQKLCNSLPVFNEELPNKTQSMNNLSTTQGLSSTAKSRNDTNQCLKDSGMKNPINPIEQSPPKNLMPKQIPKQLRLLLIDQASNDSILSVLDSKEHNIIKLKCERITYKGAIYGMLEIFQDKISFKPCEYLPEEPPFRFGALKSSLILPSKTNRVIWSFSQIKEIISRNYNLRQCGFEMFTNQGKSYFFIFNSEKQLDEIYNFLKKTPKNFKLIYDRVEEFTKLNYQKKWIDGELTNFEYLMILNKYASRSFNDLNQYPVFPWIISNYNTKELDIHTDDPNTQAKIFRDLKKPIGAISIKKKLEALTKYKSIDEEPKFHHGTHYSTSSVVMNYLIRIEPFTSMNIDLQSGRFDQPDRIFNSIENAWECCFSMNGNCRELIPEFFYFPDFLQNKNQIDFGLTQKKKKCDNVELPAWASTPIEFIYKHREALECEYISRNLNHWIDLIFGYKQRGDEAINAINVFRHLTYEGAIDLNIIETKEEQDILLEQIFHFGQTPSQLFKIKHGKKKNFFSKWKIYHDIYDYPIQSIYEKNLWNLKENYEEKSMNRANIITNKENKGMKEKQKPIKDNEEESPNTNVNDIICRISASSATSFTRSLSPVFTLLSKL